MLVNARLPGPGTQEVLWKHPELCSIQTWCVVEELATTEQFLLSKTKQKPPRVYFTCTLNHYPSFKNGPSWNHNCFSMCLVFCEKTKGKGQLDLSTFKGQGKQGILPVLAYLPQFSQSIQRALVSWALVGS